MKTSACLITFLAVFLFIGIAVWSAFADQVTLQNGDVLNGKVLSMTTNALVLQDASLGTLTLPRAKVSNITFGMVATAAPPLVSSKLNSQANSALDEPAKTGTPNTDLQA
ncbi:MAG TPA: hypothetical protein VNV43_10265, partial [Candidatus Acidoferrales bacterium]|nr:hypothetical protein [Candidatus Acidoferrales bacterium]